MQRFTGPAQKLAVITALVGLVVSSATNAHAELANAPSLTISQLKITSSSGQFITLYNPTNSPLQLENYQLVYFNHYDLSKATSSRVISLGGVLDPQGYYMVNDSQLTLCYQMAINSQSLGFSSTAGFLQVISLNQTKPGASATPTLHDYIGWSKTATTGVQTLPASTNAFLRRLPIDADYNAIVESPGTGTWQPVQPSATEACSLVTTTGNLPVEQPLQIPALSQGSDPPAIFISDDGTAQIVAIPVMPPGNIGLLAPKINELLPNPIGTGNDSTDEFIELYNPNPVNFDLTGFSLQVGSTTLRSYMFPPGTMLPPQSYTAFAASDTKLTMSNTIGQAKFLDPFGNSLSTSEPYEKAKDGQAWALAKNKWQWTTKTTPNAVNIIVLPPAKKTKASTKAKSKSASTALKKKTPLQGGASTASAAYSEEESKTPIHPYVLALIGGLALLYGAYEYRTDIANRIHQLRAYAGNRRRNRL